MASCCVCLGNKAVCPPNIGLYDGFIIGIYNTLKVIGLNKLYIGLLQTNFLKLNYR